MKTLIKIKAPKLKPKLIIEAVTYLNMAPVREHSIGDKGQSTLKLKYGKNVTRKQHDVYQSLLLDRMQCVAPISHPHNLSLLKMFSL